MQIIDGTSIKTTSATTDHIIIKLQPSEHIVIDLPNNKSIIVSADGTITQE